MRGVRCARQVLTRGRHQFTLSLNCAATLLAFRTRAAAIAAAAFAAITSAATPPTTTALTTILTFAAILAAGRGLAALAALALRIARTTVVAAISALAARAAAATAAAALSAMAVILLTPRITRGAALRCGGLVGFAAEDAFQPAQETAGFLLWLTVRRTLRGGLIWTWFKLSVFAARLARLEPSRLTDISLAAFAGRPRFTRLERPAAFATFAPLARGLESPAFVGSCRGFAGGAGGRICLPAQRGAP